MNKIGNYHIFFYDIDEYEDPILVDERERESFDEALEEVKFCWGLPFEICKVVKHPFIKNGIAFKTVARSKKYAQL